MISDDNVYITINEAVQLTGVSDKTIRRFIKDMVKSDAESATKYYKIEKKGNSGQKFQYLLHKGNIVEHFRVGSVSTEEEKVSGNNAAIAALTEQLREKDKQIERKDQQIETLQRENGILLISNRQLQEKVLVIEAPKVQDGEVGGEVKKKSKFLGWLFRRKA